jgi:hypothetical protein
MFFSHNKSTNSTFSYDVQGDYRSILNKFVSKMYICTSVNPDESYYVETTISLVIIVNR